MGLRNLKMIADQRPWMGKPSCTQLLKGIREVYLEITHDYFIDPQDAIFRIIGTKAHSELDKYTGENEMGEIRLEIEGITGAFDYLDEDGNLFDTKTYASYSVSKCLGYQTVDVPTGEVYKTGAKEGQAKTRKEVVQCEPDLNDQTLQLNLYRMMLEENSVPVNKMFLDIAVRDGNTYLAKQRGIAQNAYLINIPHIDNQQVLGYFLPKRDSLLWHLQTDTMPEPCSDEERWANASGVGMKCQKYCNVAEFCDYGQQFMKEEIDEQI